MDENGEIDLQMLFMHTVAQTGYFGDLQEKLSETTPECHKFSNYELGQYNYGIWCLSFFLIGLQFTHFGVGPLANIALDWASMKKWSAATWVAVASVLAFIVYCAYRVMEAYSRVNIAWFYLTGLFGVPILIYLNSRRLKPEGYVVHIHHYVWSGFFTTLICYQSPFLTGLHAFLNGIYIEGGAHYGFDAVWDFKGAPDTDEIFQRWFHTDIKRHTTKQRKQWIALKSLHSEKRAQHLNEVQIPVGHPDRSNS